MSGFDSFLTIVIPAGILIFIGIKIYNKMSQDNPNWFNGIKEWMGEKMASKSSKIDPMHGGSIQYSP